MDEIEANDLARPITVAIRGGGPCRSSHRSLHWPLDLAWCSPIVAAPLPRSGLVQSRDM